MTPMLPPFTLLSPSTCEDFENDILLFDPSICEESDNVFIALLFPSA